MRQEARRVPTTFLYATESKFRSSTVSSPPICIVSGDLLNGRVTGNPYAIEMIPLQLPKVYQYEHISFRYSENTFIYVTISMDLMY